MSQSPPSFLGSTGRPSPPALPPKTTMRVPVQTATWADRAAGAFVAVVAITCRKLWSYCGTVRHISQRVAPASPDDHAAASPTAE